MITELRVRNVRVFSGRQWDFPLKQLTVFCGTNSAGKSTLLKVIPLLRQTQGVRGSLRSADARLRFVGSDVDLGDFSCFASADADASDVGLGITIKDKAPARSIAHLIERSAKSRQKRDRSRIDAVNAKEMVDYYLSSDFVFDASDSIDEGSRRKTTARKREAAHDDMHSLKSARFCLQDGETDLLTWSVNRSGSVTALQEVAAERSRYLLDVPEKYFRTVGGDRFMIPESTVGDSVQMRVRLRGLLPERIIAKWRHDPKNRASRDSRKDEWGVFPIMPHIEGSTDDLTTKLANTRYIGPLRAPAKRFYITSVDPGLRTDPSGEFLPFVLKDRDNLKPVKNVRHNDDGEPIEESLFDALHYWLHFLRTGIAAQKGEMRNQIDISQTKNVLVEIKLLGPQSAVAHSIADSGFGYSQVLPILVTILMAKPGDTILIEQPELHLNPSLQVRLADFFVAMARTGRQIILETHSEHIVNAMRVLVAEDMSDHLRDMCRIYYLDATAGTLETSLLDIQPDGTIPEWPPHFFGEALSLSGRLLRAQKRFRTSGGGNR